MAHLNCPSCHTSMWAPYQQHPHHHMHPSQYGQDPQEGYDYRNIPSHHGILRSSSTMSVNVPYVEYEQRRQMEIQQQQQQQWGAQRGSAFQKYQTRSRRGDSPAPSNKSNKSRSKSLPGKNFGRRTATSDSEEEGGEEDEDENCEEFFSSSHAHEESEDEDEERLPEVAPYKWECEHCTYINDEGTRVCAICCKTPTKIFNPAPNENQTSSRRSTSKPSIRRGSAKQQIAARRRQEQEFRANEEAREKRRLRSLPVENNESDAIEDDYAMVKRGSSRPSSRKSSRATVEQPYKSMKAKPETKSKSKEREIIKPEPIKAVAPPQPTVVDKKGKNKENIITLQPAICNNDKKASSTDEDSVKPIKKKKRISFWFGTHFNAFKKH